MPSISTKIGTRYYEFYALEDLELSKAIFASGEWESPNKFEDKLEDLEIEFDYDLFEYWE